MHAPSNPETRHASFAGVCNCLTKDGRDLEYRCGLLKDLRGRVLELGPGPFTNAPCFVGKPIESYVGVEPNAYFHPLIRNKTAALGLPFPIDIRTLAGEQLDLEAESVDQVILTHVLCSVTSIEAVMREVHRVLRPGGKIFIVRRRTYIYR